MKSEIPNLYGTVTYLEGSNTTDNIGSGVFSTTSGNKWTVSEGGGNHRKQQVIFDASACCDRYGDYTEVNPLYESCLFIIKY